MSQPILKYRERMRVASCRETPDLTEMPFGLCARVGPKNHIFGGGPDPPQGKGNFGGCSTPFVVHCNRESTEGACIHSSVALGLSSFADTHLHFCNIAVCKDKLHNLLM